MVFCNAQECSSLILLSILPRAPFFFFFLNQAAVGLDFISFWEWGQGELYESRKRIQIPITWTGSRLS